MNQRTNVLKLAAREYRDDPWKMFGQLREKGTILKVKMPFMGKCWAATTYESVNTILKDTDRFVRDPRNAGRKTFIPMQWMLPRVFLSLTHNMLSADGNNHRRLRSLVDQAFARRNIDGMANRIEKLAIEQMDDLANAARHGVVDFQEHFGRPFPLTVICELLGLPMEDRPKFREWFAPMSKVTSVFGIFSMSRGMKKVSKYLNNQIEEVRANPRDGLISDLVQAEHEGHQLNENELLSMIFLLLVAGHETTVHLLSNTIYALFEFPDTRQELTADWSLGPVVIEEVLRYCSPIQMAKPRYVANDMDYFGQSLKRGEMILPLLASANFDPERFDNPTTFDIHREQNYHMTFGSGPHVCLGMKLARTETRFAIKALFDRWPNVEAAFEIGSPDWSKRIGMRGMNTLNIRLGN